MEKPQETTWDVQFNCKRIFLHLYTFLKDLMPFILSHHPECEKFSENHYISVAGVKLCIGCFFSYPTVLILLVLQAIFHYWQFLPTNIAVLLLLVMIVIQVLALSDVWEYNLGWKIFTKIALGTGLVLVFLLIFRLPISRLAKWFFSYFFYVTFGGLLGIVRAYRMDSVCSACEEYATFPMCEGFRGILSRLQDDRFITLTERGNPHSSPK